MDEYLTWFLDATHWHWLALAVALAGFEMLTMSFFLIFPALSAALVGLVVYIEPTLDWQVQVLITSVKPQMYCCRSRGLWSSSPHRVASRSKP